MSFYLIPFDNEKYRMATFLETIPKVRMYLTSIILKLKNYKKLKKYLKLLRSVWNECSFGAWMKIIGWVVFEKQYWKFNIAWQ